MKTHALLSALGRDRVGVADDLATVLAGRNIEIEHSRMAALGGRFALIVQVCGQEAGVTKLRRDLGRVAANLGCQLQLEPLEPERPSAKAPQYLIESFLAGPSAVSSVTALLKRHGINIEELETQAATAAWDSEVTFEMKARITIPPSCSLAALRREIRELEAERDVDILLKPLGSRIPEMSAVNV